MSAADPDLVLGGVVAVRRFTPDERGRLRPLHERDGYVWAPGVNLAQCTRADHDAPAPGCTCGLYAVNDAKRLPLGPITGVVELTGRIEFGDRGYRAERGRVVALAAAVSQERRFAWDVLDAMNYVLLGLVLALLGAMACGAYIAAPPGGAYSARLLLPIALAPMLVGAVVMMVLAARKAAENARGEQQRSPVIDLDRLARLYPEVQVYPSEAELLAAHPLSKVPVVLLGEDDSASPDFWKVDL